MSGMWMATGTRYRLGCVDGDGLVAGEGPVSGECKSVAAGHAGRGWRELAEGQVCMDGDGISARSGVRIGGGTGGVSLAGPWMAAGLA
jgi:hypothetical protein